MKKFKHIILYIFLCTMVNFSCSSNYQPVPPITSEDYSIYSVLINDLSSSSGYSRAFIWDSTFTSVVNYECKYKGGKKILIYHEVGVGNHAPSPSDVILHIWPEFDLNFYKKEFDRNNTKSYPLILESIHANIPIQPNKIDSVSSHMIKNGQALQIWFSRVAFNPEHNEALIYLDYVCGSLCGEGKWYWMKKSEGLWKVHKSFYTWVS